MREDRESNEVFLEVPCDTYYLASIRTLVRTVARKAGFKEEVAGQIQMAVDEVCAAAAFEQKRTGSDLGEVEEERVLSVSLCADARKLRATITEHGVAGPLAMSLYDLPDPGSQGGAGGGVTGMGYVVVTSYMDEVEFNETDEGCQVHLVRYLRHPSARLRRRD